MAKAKEFLLQVKKLDTMIRNDMAEKARWESVALGIGSPQMGDKVQTTKNPHKMADAIGESVDIEQRIKDKILERQHKREEILQVIERLTEPEYDLLYKVYFQNQTLKEAAAQVDRSYSNATTLHGIALKNLQGLLDEMGTEVKV